MDDFLISLASKILYFFGYFIFSLSIFRYREIRFGYTVGLFVFLTIQYGPHTALFTEMLQLSTHSNSSNVNDIYCFVMGFVFLIVGGIFLVAPAELVTGIKASNNKLSNETFGYYQSRLIIFLCVLLSISLILQSGGKIALEHLRFISGGSLFSYNEIRRELFSDTPWSSFASIFRFSVVPVFYSYFLVLLMFEGRKRHTIIKFCLVLFFVFFGFIQLNKFFYLYYFILSVMVLYLYRQDRGAKFLVRNFLLFLPVVIILMFVFLYLVLMLYKFQYSEALSRGILSIDDIKNTLVFRVFFASSDSLRLWIDYFGVGGNYKGVSVIGKVCSIVGECFNPNTFIPYYYLSREATSMQAGFVGTGLGVGGWFGIPVVSVLVAIIVMFNNWVLAIQRNSLFVYSIAPIMFLNSFFLTTRELHTSLLSGGAILVGVVVVLLFGYVRVEMRHAG